VSELGLIYKRTRGICFDAKGRPGEGKARTAAGGSGGTAVGASGQWAMRSTPSEGQGGPEPLSACMGPTSRVSRQEGSGHRGMARCRVAARALERLTAKNDPINAFD
jgi:hypothetical protein